MPLRIHIYSKFVAFIINSVTLTRMKEQNIHLVIFTTLNDTSFKPVRDIRASFQECGMHVSWIRLRLVLRRLVKQGRIEKASTKRLDSCFRPHTVFRLTKIS